MSLIFVDGFDDGLTSLKWAQLYGISAGNGRTGDALLLASGDTRTSRFVVNSTDEHATFILGFAWKPAGSQNQELVRFISDTSSTYHVCIAQNVNQALYATRGAGGTLLGTTANNVVSLGIWQYVEIKVVLSDTVGEVTIKVDGATVLNLTNIDTKNGGTKTVLEGCYFRVDFPVGNSYFDDLYLCNGAGSVNNDFLGDCSVETIYPNGNGNSSQLVGSDGNSVDNYLLVDEAGAPSTADYVGSGVDGAKDTYAFSNLTQVTGAVKGLAVRSYAAKTDTGARSLSNVIRSGGSDTVKTAQALGTGYDIHSDIVELDPNGSVAWTIASVNAAEFGVQVGAP